MKRSVSITTTNTVFQVRVGKYQKALIINNAIILLLSLMGLFLGLVWKVFYHMDKLTFIDEEFVSFSWLEISVCMVSVLIVFVGFIAAAGEIKILLYIYAGLLSVVAISWIACLFMAFRLMPRQEHPLSQRNANNVKHAFKEKMAMNNDVFEAINKIESDFNCCGLTDDLDGYRFYEHFNPIASLHSSMAGYVKDWNKGSEVAGVFKPDNGGTGVPKSCCLLPLKTKDNCRNEDVLRVTDFSNLNKIQVARVGCLAVIDEKYQNDVVPMMYIFCLGAVVCMLLEVATIALSIAYAVVIAKRSKRYGYAGDENFTTTSGL